MSFKENLYRDIGTTFLNPEYFGEEHLINKRPVMVVIDNGELKRRQGGGEFAVEESGTLFYIRTELLPPGLAPGNRISFDRRQCLVDDIKHEMGLSCVVLRENISR